MCLSAVDKALPESQPAYICKNFQLHTAGYDARGASIEIAAVRIDDIIECICDHPR
jgi:hypothetical protein